MTVEAKAVWEEGLRFKGLSGDQQITMDTSADHGGGAGMSPMRVVLTGLCGCTAMDVISILEKKRQQVTDFEVRAEAERADDHPKVYTKIHLTYVVTGHDIDEKAVARSVELTDEKYCSVMATLRGGPADITTSYEIHEAE
jgi:putative redox protein